MKLTSVTTILIFLVVLTLFIIGIYQIFLTPADEINTTPITQISTYYGEDVLEFINSD